MTRPIAALYKKNNPQTAKLLQKAVDRGIGRSEKAPLVFFRADDIGFVSHQYCTMIELFKQYHMPLALAVVPSWLNAQRRDALFKYTEPDRTLWCWHQHGHRHLNFAREGKKQEFGGNRSPQAIRQSLAHGQAHLLNLFEANFTPVFTPPWNRCSATAIEELIHLGFSAISRSLGAKPQAPPQLIDLQVNVDLHTRKEKNTDLALHNLLAELEEALASGWCGIMLHHQRMNRRAQEFLDILLATLSAQGPVNITTFPELLQNPELIHKLQRNPG